MKWVLEMLGKNEWIVNSFLKTIKYQIEQIVRDYNIITTHNITQYIDFNTLLDNSVLVLYDYKNQIPIFDRIKLKDVNVFELPKIHCITSIRDTYFIDSSIEQSAIILAREFQKIFNNIFSVINSKFKVKGIMFLNNLYFEQGFYKFEHNVIFEFGLCIYSPSNREWRYYDDGSNERFRKFSEYNFFRP